ncbi:hypothetical protein ACN9MG_05795 [Burkholderia ambifaria]|uniref:hypothetical protein n=2 Tax=Burkholderiaceae TaxID=119060 RepID=UPI00158F374A
MNRQNLLFVLVTMAFTDRKARIRHHIYYPNLSPSQRQAGFLAAHPYAIAVDAIELQTAIGSPRSYVREVARDIR